MLFLTTSNPIRKLQRIQIKPVHEQPIPILVGTIKLLIIIDSADVKKIIRKLFVYNKSLVNKYYYYSH